jgi:hypothetical protein
MDGGGNEKELTIDNARPAACLIPNVHQRLIHCLEKEEGARMGPLKGNR